MMKAQTMRQLRRIHHYIGVFFTPAILLLGTLTAGCTQPGGPFPTLAPRPAEAVDPRLPV